MSDVHAAAYAELRARVGDVIRQAGEDAFDRPAPATPELTDVVDEPPPAAKKTASRRKPRPSVPSWDDIMFGAKRD